MPEIGNNHADGARSATVPASVQGQPLSLSDRVRSLRLSDRQVQPPAKTSWLPWALCLALLAATGYFALGSIEKNKLAKEVQDLRQAAAAAGETQPGRMAVNRDSIALEGKGYIIPISLLQVSPLVGARVEKLFIKEGDKVPEGAVLAKLETTEFQSDCDRIKGMIASCKRRKAELETYRELEIAQMAAELNETKEQVDQLYSEYQRNIDLKNRNSVSQKDFDQARYSYTSMKNRMERLKLARDLLIKGPRDERIASIQGEIEQGQADLRKAEWRLKNCTVIAPIAESARRGTVYHILSKKAEEGNMINPSAFSNGLSASLCEMADLSEMEVDLAIAERDIAKVFVKQECQVRAEAFPERPYKGFVSRIMPQADRAKGAVPTRVKILIPPEEAGVYLRPEMGAIVTFLNPKQDEKQK
jgi:HlyD family secretion protein